MKNKVLALLVSALMIFGVMGAPAMAATETTTTVLYLNVASTLSFEVTLLGESATTSSPGGQASTKNIEFNCSDGTTDNIQGQITGGGSTQTDGNPILSVDNVGTVNIEPLNISLNATMPACATLYYSATFTADCSSGATMTTAEIEVDSSFTPAEAAKPLYLCVDTSSCGVSDSTTRLFTVEGTG